MVDMIGHWDRPLDASPRGVYGDRRTIDFYLSVDLAQGRASAEQLAEELAFKTAGAMYDLDMSSVPTTKVPMHAGALLDSRSLIALISDTASQDVPAAPPAPTSLEKAMLAGDAAGFVDQFTSDFKERNYLAVFEVEGQPVAALTHDGRLDIGNNLQGNDFYYEWWSYVGNSLPGPYDPPVPRSDYMDKAVDFLSSLIADTMGKTPTVDRHAPGDSPSALEFRHALYPHLSAEEIEKQIIHAGQRIATSELDAAAFDAWVQKLHDLDISDYDVLALLK